VYVAMTCHQARIMPCKYRRCVGDKVLEHLVTAPTEEENDIPCTEKKRLKLTEVEARRRD